MTEREFLKWAQSYVDIFSVVNMVQQPIHFITPDGIVQYVNQAWIDVYKVPRKNVLQRHISTIDEVTRTMNYYLSFYELEHDLTDNFSDLSYNYLQTPTNIPAC